MPKILQRVGTIKFFNIMKSYKKATLVAKNARSGSYAAGCPQYDYFTGHNASKGYCYMCERTY